MDKQKNNDVKISVLVICAVVAGIALVCGGYFIYQQQTHFNKNIQINGVNVGDLTAKEARAKVAKTKVEKKVYLNGKLFYTAEPKTSEITAKDQAKFEATLKKQATFLPNSEQKNYTIVPADLVGKKDATLQDAVTNKLTAENKTRTAPVDAYAILEGGKVKVQKEVKGTSKLLNISDITKRIGNFFKLPIQLSWGIAYPELAFLVIFLSLKDLL